MTKKELINSSDHFVNENVKIAGTNYDRRRKVTGDMKHRMVQMHNAGKSYSTIAAHFNVCYDTVKRTVEPYYNELEKERKRLLQLEKNYQYKVPGVDKELADYKRSLLEKRRPLLISL